jgi:3-methylcrotonyl-CoA carboxylase alpha subunit
MFNKILIANRGEIACRVIKTAKKMGIRTVAVFSDADRQSLHVKMADEAIHIGGSASKESYLLGERILQAALKTGANAIHPGYGFLSENAKFAEQCVENNIVFIGPPVKAIESMGSKSAAKTIMEAANVPLVPGYHGDDQDSAILKKSADDMGYPVLLKAVAGGGGKGMRQVWSEDQFEQALTQAKSESMASFGDDNMLVEKYLTQPRHVEFQVFCDQHGNGVYLFERDCSVQRRHQKVIEEAPAPNMPEVLRKEMGEAAVRAAQAIDYEGAGTVEFLLDTDGSFFFMEMNTRLQVEHPVTEMITGEDLVEWQLRVADGETLPKSQEQLKIRGHSFESRIYAEDPNNDFLPTSGHLTFLKVPEENSNVRVDTGVVEGDDVSPYYDPMIAKLIVWDEDRERALARMARSLMEYRIHGVTTNISFLYNLVTSAPFMAADIDTGFIEKHEDKLFFEADLDLNNCLSLIAAYLVLNRQSIKDHDSPWQANSAWRMNQENNHYFEIIIGDKHFPLAVEDLTAGASGVFKIRVNDHSLDVRASLDQEKIIGEVNGHRQQAFIASHDHAFTLFTEQRALDFQLARPDFGDADSENAQGDFNAPMNGTIVEVLVKPDDVVEKGNALLVMEAMKMQYTISAPSAGVVTELFCADGDLVSGGDELLSFEPS